MVTCIQNFTTKVKVRSPLTEKGSRLQLCFRVLMTFQSRKGWICDSRFQGRDLRDFFALKLFSDYSLCSVCTLPQSAVLILHFAPSLHFTLSLQSAFYPWSAVCVLH